MYFLRLIRPVNLAVIALTMYAVRVFFLPSIRAQVLLERIQSQFPFGSETISVGPFSVTNSGRSDVLSHSSESLDYFLLVLSTLLIAAAGNMINDYFDVKADRINRPEKLIVTRYIKPRAVILWHWILNFVAFSIACYLSWRYETFWYLFIHLFSINALWFYSMYFKRKFLTGNLLIALLTALVPVLSGMHFLKLGYNSDVWIGHRGWTLVGEPISGFTGYNLPIFFVFFFASFAFALNLVREIVKDVEDMEGDKVLRAKTIPLVLGVAKTRWICIGLLSAIPVVASPFIIEGYALYPQNFIRFMSPALLIVTLLLFGIVQLLLSTEKRALKRTDFAIKLAMIVGCCMPYYWYFL